MIEPAEFRKLMEFLSKAYPRFTLEPETIEVYYQILGDLSPDLIKAAILQLISDDSPWCPSAGQIRGRAFDLLDHESGVPNAWDAWAEVCKCIGDHGYVRVPEFSHPLIKRTVDCVGGWLQLCWSENAVADRARFVQAYETLAKRERAQVRMLPQVREALELVSGERRQAIETLTSECVDKLRGDMRTAAPEPVGGIMAWRIVKQPNGRLARFSDIVDDFTTMNMTEAEAFSLCRVRLGIEDAKRKMQAGLEDWKPWMLKVKGNGTERWEHDLSTIETVHGKKVAEERRSMGTAAPEPVA